LASKLKTIRLIIVLIASIWFVGAAIMTVVYEYERRSECQLRVTLERFRWCESDIYSREDLGFSYKDLFILGLGWPSHLISSEHDSITTLTNVIIPGKGKEEIPPVGENQALNDPQVRWCVFEKVRLGNMKLETITDHERAEFMEEAESKKYLASRADVLKKYVARYDERCTKFRSQQGTLGVIERELLFEGKRLQSEARQR